MLMDYKNQNDRVLNFEEFTVCIENSLSTFLGLHFIEQEIMDQIKEAGWVRFKPVDGQPITEKDMKKVFRMVDMDKSGAISQLV